MYRIYLSIHLMILLLFVITISSNAQSTESDNVNNSLKQELLEIQKKDQLYRGNLNAILSNPKSLDSLSKAWDVPKSQMGGAIWQKQQQLDKENLTRVTEILRKQGYPGISKVGENTSSAAFYVLQHAPKDTMEQYFHYIEKAVAEDELAEQYQAMMHDRIEMYNNRPQRYGTQSRGFQLDNGERMQVIWPIENPELVNKLRREAGFDLTVEQNAKRLGITYKVYTIEELEEITGENLQ